MKQNCSIGYLSSIRFLYVLLPHKKFNSVFVASKRNFVVRKRIHKNQIMFDNRWISLVLCRLLHMVYTMRQSEVSHATNSRSSPFYFDIIFPLTLFYF